MKAIKKVDKNGNVSYKLRVFVGRDKDNKVKIVSHTWKPDPLWSAARVQKELQIAQLHFEEEVNSQIIAYSDGINSNINKNISFEEFSHIYIRDYAMIALKKRTIRDYEGRLKRIIPAIGHIRLQDFSPVIINKFLSNLSEPGVKLTTKKGMTPQGLSSKSIKNYKILLSSIFTRAVEWEYIDKTPMIGIVTPKVISKKTKPLSQKEVQNLIKLLKEKAPLKYYVFFVLDVITGMRRGELLALTWDKIDNKKQLMTIDSNLLYTSEDGIYTDSTKTESSNRIIHISKWLNELLKEYKNEQEKMKYEAEKENVCSNWNPQGYLFVQKDGSPMHPNTPYGWFMKFQKKNGLRVVNIQTLRHTTATLLILNQVNTKLVSGRLGHSSTKTTNDIYAQYIKEADEFVSDVLDDIIVSDVNE